MSIGLICDRCGKSYLTEQIPTPGLCPGCISEHPAYKVWRTRPRQAAAIAIAGGV